MPYLPMVHQCRKDSSRHSARTGHTAHRASAHTASARAAFATVATGNHSSGPISVTAHLASGLITKPAKLLVAEFGRLGPLQAARWLPGATT